MKLIRAFLLLTIFYPSSFEHLCASNSSDSLRSIYKSVDTIRRNMDTIKNKNDSIINRITLLSKDPQKSDCIICNKSAEELKWQHWSLVFGPALLLFLYSIFFMIGLISKENVETERAAGKGTRTVSPLIALLSDVPSVKSKANLDPTDNPPLIPSISRFILFLSGVASIIIGMAVTMYYGYIIVAECNREILGDGLIKVFLGLGLGIIPYGLDAWRKRSES